MFRRKRFYFGEESGSDKLRKSLSELNAERYSRRKATKIGGRVGTLLASGVNGMWQFDINPSFREALVKIGTWAFAGLIAGKAVGYKLRSKRIKLATEKVKNAIAEETLDNKDLKNFIFSHKYVYIDKEGNITATRINPSKLWPSYIRLNVSEIKKERTRIGVWRAFPPDPYSKP